MKCQSFFNFKFQLKARMNLIKIKNLFCVCVWFVEALCSKLKQESHLDLLSVVVTYQFNLFPPFFIVRFNFIRTGEEEYAFIIFFSNINRILF